MRRERRAHHRPAVRLAAALIVACCLPATAHALRDARDVPLIDQTGRTFTLRALHRPAAVVFIDTDCRDACSVAEGVFARVADRLTPTHLDARLVTVTLDPDTEPPAVMASAARRFRADAARWRWASGAPSDVKDLMGAFNVVRNGKNVHSTSVYVLDARGLPAREIMLSTRADADLLDALRTASQRA